MKAKDRKALHDKDIKELSKMLDEARGELTNLKMDHSQRKLKNTRSMYVKLKEIAMIQTALQARKIEQLMAKEGEINL